MTLPCVKLTELTSTLHSKVMDRLRYVRESLSHTHLKIENCMYTGKKKEQGDKGRRDGVTTHSHFGGG